MVPNHLSDSCSTYSGGWKLEGGGGLEWLWGGSYSKGVVLDVGSI